MPSRIDLQQLANDLAPDFAARAVEHDAEDRFVSENYAALKAARAFSALVPQELGGGGATHREMCAFLNRLARACPSTALALSMHQHLVAAAAANHAAGRPGGALLERVADGELVLVSTGANDWLDSNGAAEPVEGGYRVTAVKPFASGSPAGDVMITSAAIAGGGEVLHFPVPLSADGVRFLDNWRALGMRGSGSQTVELDGVFVPEDAVVLRRPQGPFHPAFAVILAVAMPIILSAYVGVAEAAAEIARDAAGGGADDPGSQMLAGQLENRLVAARLATQDMVRLADGYAFEPSVDLARDVLVRKTLAANAVIGAGEKAMELAGGRGFMRRTGIERLFRDLHGARFHPLPEARQLLFAGRVALGLDPVVARSDPSRVHAA
jgi:acyl-CoA dehydrogenase